MGQIDILLADDHPVLLQGLLGLLDGHNDFRVVGACISGPEALEVIRSKGPGLAVLDITMPELDGLALLAAIRREDLPVKVVFLTAFARDDQIFNAVAAGVDGIVLKASVPEVLVSCLHDVAAGGRWLPEDVVGPALQREMSRRQRMRRTLGELSSRELEIVGLVGGGASNKEIARHVGLSPGTVKVHLERIYQKTGLTNRTALAAFFVEHKNQVDDRCARAAIVDDR
jgi:DNA-binding NarL/FixJ family response regulator